MRRVGSQGNIVQYVSFLCVRTTLPQSKCLELMRLRTQQFSLMVRTPFRHETEV